MKGGKEQRKRFVGGAEVWRLPCGLLGAARTKCAGEGRARPVGTQRRALSRLGQPRIGISGKITEVAIWEVGWRG